MTDSATTDPATTGTAPDLALSRFLQHTHLEKVYGYLPGLSDALPLIMGTTPADYAEFFAWYDGQARAAAADLLADDAFAQAVDALPFRDGQTVLAVGDSITDDLQSWAEILRHLLNLRRPQAGITIVNAGLSAHTTAMILRRWPATLASRPDWILCGLGGNDVSRVGPQPNKTSVGLDESVANLRELHRIATAREITNWVWLTPVPVDEERVQAYPPFRFGDSSWANADIVALADAVRGFDEPVVDLVETFGVPPVPQWQGEDGVHVTLAGQSSIAAALVNTLVR